MMKCKKLMAALSLGFLFSLSLLPAGALAQQSQTQGGTFAAQPAYSSCSPWEHGRGNC